MSLCAGGVSSPICSFPCVSGDEPVVDSTDSPPVRFSRVSGDEPGAKAVMAVMDQFSPREWG